MEHLNLLQLPNNECIKLNSNKTGYYYANAATLIADRTIYDSTGRLAPNPFAAPENGVFVGSVISKGTGFTKLLLDGYPCWIGRYGGIAYKSGDNTYDENFIVFMKKGQVLSSDGQTQQAGDTYIGIFRAWFIPIS